VKVATTISVTNTVVWEKTTEGTAEIFENENAAQSRFYDKMATQCSQAPVADRKKMRKRFSEEYYDKEKK